MTETTERIVEAYVRSVKGWATIPNVRCAGQNEIDLVALDPVSLARYHIEVSVSISQGFRKLTAKPYDVEKAKQRVHQASQRRTVGFFVEKKFSSPGVIEKLKKMGFETGKYGRIVVTWGWDDSASEAAQAAGIELWDFPTMMRELASSLRGSSEYYTDDTLRTINLFIHAADEERRESRAESLPANPKPRTASKRTPGSAATTPAAPVRRPPLSGEQFWVYENWTHDYAAIHRGECSFCNYGRGMHVGSSTKNGEWLGPFADLDEAKARAKQTKRASVRRCNVCAP